MKLTWNEGYLSIDPPKKPKKITGTRFANIFELSPWNTPFKTWCEITKTYQEPFEDNQFTLAGKAIEPIQIAHFEEQSMMHTITPEMMYGSNYFSVTWGDFFKEDKVFGGMWDALIQTGDDITGVVEFKTSSRPQDWVDGVPMYYELQVALYAALLGVDDVFVVCSFLKDNDYVTPENFKPTPDNTVFYQFSMSEKYPNFERDYMTPAREWWDVTVLGGTSPAFDEKADKDILLALRTTTVDSNMDLTSLLDNISTLQTEVDTVLATIKDKEMLLKEYNDMLKQHLRKAMSDTDTKAVVEHNKVAYTLSRSQTTTIDKKQLEADGLLDMYSKTSERLTLTNKQI